MKVLWITNILFPEVAALNEFKASGGWMLSLAETIIRQDDIQLVVVSVSPLVKELTFLKGKEITYYLIPTCHKVKKYEPFMRIIKDRIAPDAIHIHGTELPYGMAYLNACGPDRVVISIQGLISVIARYYCYGLKKSDILRNLTIWADKKDFIHRGQLEIQTLSKVSHVIGRTSFDKANVWVISPGAEYHFCNEILRSEFYEGCWEYDNCVPHTIFLSQAWYPIKGLHQVLKAMPFILTHYPDVQLRIAGSDITKCLSLKTKIARSSYGMIIRRMIKKYHIEKCITFTGTLRAEEMKQELLKANLFICPSSIENSSNSLGEAQLLGTPCLASFVGGIPDMIPNKDCGELYRFEEIEMLAYKVCDIFEYSKTFDNTVMRQIAAERHDRKTNVENTLNIYNNL
ncbi:MAG: glycosyltransferase family 4 protein [Eubacteriales bacterium]|nr:glycosyltransferase family 4 protein [Eubacteriales bacterium]